MSWIFDSISECFAFQDEQKGWEQSHPKKKELTSFKRTVGRRTLDDHWAQHWPVTRTPQRVTACRGSAGEITFVTQPSETWIDSSLCFHQQDFVGRGFPVGCTYQEQAKRSAGGPMGGSTSSDGDARRRASCVTCVWFSQSHNQDTCSISPSG